ncbi:MAG TPA: septum site-determining protein Ssd [Acidothermaceae bacterium]
MKSTGHSSSARPLVITSDAEILDDLLRLAAAAGAAVDVVPDAAAARVFWAAAPLVLIGDDVLRRAVRRPASARLRRRPGVVLITRDGDDSGVWPRAVEVGAEQVCVLPAAEPWLIGALADATDPPARAATLVATIGGRGGAGASCLAAALAVTAGRMGDVVTFVDGDHLGGGADLLFGGEGAAGARWSDLAATRGRIPSRSLREALPSLAGLAVLSWDRAPGQVADPDADLEADRATDDPLDPAGGQAGQDRAGAARDVDAEVMTNVLDAVTRASDLVVVDLPRRFDDATCAALSAADQVLVITPAELRAAAATRRVVAAVAAHATDARLVVRGPAPGGLRGVDIAAAVGLPLAGELRAEPNLSACLERGEAPAGRGIGPLAALCARLLAQLRASRPSGGAERWPA